MMFEAIMASFSRLSKMIVGEVIIYAGIYA